MEAKREYLELRAVQLKEQNFSPTKDITEQENFAPSREPVKRRNRIIGITLLVLLIVLFIFLGDLLIEYFGQL